MYYFEEYLLCALRERHASVHQQWQNLLLSLNLAQKEQTVYQRLFDLQCSAFPLDVIPKENQKEAAELHHCILFDDAYSTRRFWIFVYAAQSEQYHQLLKIENMQDCPILSPQKEKRLVELFLKAFVMLGTYPPIAPLQTLI